MKAPKFQIKPRSRSVVDVSFSLRAGQSQWFLLSSDRHWDNPTSDHSLQRKHLQEAKERGAGIIDCGDLFCAMQGRYDPRSSKSDVRPEHAKGDYLDALVETAGEFFRPYAANFIQIAQGNHEASILKRLETDLTTRLVERINTLEKTKIHRAGFSGWVVFRVNLHGREYQTRRIAWHHGYGGDAPVTKGVIQTNRMAVYLPDADFVLTGHTHNVWVFPITRARITNRGRLFQDEQLHLKMPSYKNEYGDGFSGWHIERGAPPKPIGALWLRLSNEARELRTEITRAK
jgi:predicted phosphodiesterase